MDVFGTIMNCWNLIREVDQLIDLCRTRGSRFDGFKSYMEVVVGVLKSLKPYLVENARPIASHIQKEIRQAHTKIDRYSERGLLNSAWHARKEDEKLSSIRSRIQQLLLMLVAVNTGGEQLQGLEASLLTKLEEHADDTHVHLQSLQGQLGRLHAVVAASAQPNSHSAANDVQRKLEELKQGQQMLSARVTQLLAQTCGELQMELASAVMRLEKPLMKLQESQDAWMTELERAMRVESQELKKHVTDMGRDVVADLRKEHEETRRVVMDQGELTRQHMDMLHKGLVTLIVERNIKRNASGEGEADMPAVTNFLRCRATNLPFTRSGEGMPVLLLACGCSMSQLAARKAGQVGKCPFCDAALEGVERLFVVDDRMRRLVMEDRCGEELPQLERADIQLGEMLGRGAEGKVFRATYRGQPVAVKEVEVLRPDARKQVEDVLWTMLLASSCKQVCTLYGVCWVDGDSRVLLVMDLCVATLETTVRQGSPKGWPTADVIVLGLELLEALHAVHHGAHALHLDVKPSNVLLTEARTVVLADFGICEHVPPIMTNSTLSNVRPGTLGFAAHEQFLEGRASPATDIYGLGVTLVFAACGHNSWSHKNLRQLAGCMNRGERLPVPGSIQADLRALLVDMTEPERTRRPSLHAVRTRLQHLLEAEAVAPKHIQPCWQAPHQKKVAQQGGSLKPTSVLEGHSNTVYSVAWSPDGAQLATASLDNTAAVWVAASGSRVVQLQGHSNAIRSVAWSPDGAQVATASWDKTAAVWDTVSGSRVVRLQGHSNTIRSVVWRPDGAQLATASWDSTAAVWDAVSGSRVVRLQGHSRPVRSVAWSPNGAQLATASWDEMAAVWDTASGSRVVQLQGHSDAVESVAWSPDGTQLATASRDNTAAVWDAALGSRVVQLQGHSKLVYCVAWSPDGAKLATASGDNTAAVWDAASGSRVVQLQGHSRPVRTVAWSPDGAQLATASWDGTAAVWDAASGNRVVQLQGHGCAVNAVAWSPDGAQLATASHDNTAAVWTLFV